jgi:hypothetical protein
LSHISTVFWCDSNTSLLLRGVDIEIHVGKESPELQALMRERGIKGIVGMTPKFPIQYPAASPECNEKLVKQFEDKLLNLGIEYCPAYGRARDFRQGGTGCFLLINISPEEAMELLLEDGEPTQLSFTFLPPDGEAKLVSCVEPKPQNRIKAILRQLTQKERAIALCFLGAALADLPRPAATSPRLMEFVFLANSIRTESQIKLANLVSRLLANPNLLK